jgi:type III restriction enzyme
VSQPGISEYHACYFAHELTRRCPSDSIQKLAATLANVQAQVDLNPHQIDAALFAFRSPLSKGAILADEVGLGKTIEAGILLSQKWAERKRKLLVIVPANLRKQWNQELSDKFFLPSVILETRTFNEQIKQGNLNPFNRDEIVICSYHFARSKDVYIQQVNWHLIVIDEAHRLRNVYKPTNRITQVILDPAKDLQPTRTVIAKPTILAKLSATPPPETPGKTPGKPAEPLFPTEQERKIAEITVKVIQQHETLPQANYLQKPDVQAAIIREVAATYVAPTQTELTGIVEKPDIAAIVAKATKLVIDQTIDIPRIVVVPTGEVTSGFNHFTLDCSSVHLQPVSRELLIQHLRTAKQEFLQNVSGQNLELRLEDYLIRALIDFDDISYDDHADLLYELAGQIVAHLKTYLTDEKDVVNVLQYHQQHLAALIHSQMQMPEHRWEKATGYKANVSKGFTALKENAYTASAKDEIKPFRMTVPDPSNIKKYLFGGFSKCLYEIQKFDVDTERRFAVILEDDTDVLKWFKPARGQFQIYYNKDAAYEPDFVVETTKQNFLCEPKRADQMTNPEVLAKREATKEWCRHATEHAKEFGGKPWSYLLIPHDAITGNMTLDGLASRYTA